MAPKQRRHGSPAQAEPLSRGIRPTCSRRLHQARDSRRLKTLFLQVSPGHLETRRNRCPHYGPNVPIGGGAICGKDVHKPDRVGALRARQIAQRLAQSANDTARVTLGYLPGLENPDRLDAVLGDGRRLDKKEVASLIALPDSSLAGTVKDLELWRTPWADVMREGYFGNPGRKWET